MQFPEGSWPNKYHKKQPDEGKYYQHYPTLPEQRICWRGCTQLFTIANRESCVLFYFSINHRHLWSSRNMQQKKTMSPSLFTSILPFFHIINFISKCGFVLCCAWIMKTNSFFIQRLIKEINSKRTPKLFGFQRKIEEKV